jgi:hypothetical protein
MKKKRRDDEDFRKESTPISDQFFGPIFLTCGPRRFGRSSYWFEILLGNACAVFTKTVFDHTPKPIKRSRRRRSDTSFVWPSGTRSRSLVNLFSTFLPFNLGVKLKVVSRASITTRNHVRSNSILKVFSYGVLSLLKIAMCCPRESDVRVCGAISKRLALRCLWCLRFVSYIFIWARDK